MCSRNCVSIYAPDQTSSPIILLVRCFLFYKSLRQDGSEHVHLAFPHNETAYASLLTVPEAKQRACIIHLIGTGKSFIGFQLL